MSGAGVREAIREMTRLPRSRTPWPRWKWIVGAVLPVPGVALLARVIGRVWTWAVICTLMGLGLGLLPLFGVLGFELAFACTIVAAVMGLDLGAALARQLQRLPAKGITRAEFPGRALARSAVTAALLPAAIISIPAVISAFRGIVVPTCDWWFGILAFLAMPLATAVLGGGMGHAIGIVVGPRRYLGAALAQLPLLVVAAMALWRFYAAPAVFTYNAVLGYFPGNLYDENVQLGAALAWSRLEQLLVVDGAVAIVGLWLDVPRWRVARAARPAGRRLGALALAAVALGGAAFLRTQSGHLGYAVDAEDIEEALGGRLETPHFIIHYDKTEEIEKVIGLVAADHEFRYAQVTSRIGVQASSKIRSFYFSDRDQKARWMGARDVEMAKPWRREIYLEHRGFPHGSLRHEIAHAVAAEFGDPWFGVAAKRVLGLPVFISPGLIEGLAVAIDWPGNYERMTPHEAVRVLQGMGAQPKIANLIGLQFFSVSSASGYTTAGSFLRFLLDAYGAEKLRAVYHSGGDFEHVYDRPLADLERDWLAMLETIELPKGAVEASRERFRVGSVFSRPCPHAIAKRRELAFEALGDGDRDRAVGLMRTVCGDAPEEPRHKVALGQMLDGGDAYQRAEAHVLWTALAYDESRVTSTIRAEAFERLARAAAARGADDAVQHILRRAVTLPVDINERRQLDALAFALAHEGPAGPALRGYFFAAVPGIEPSTWALLATLAEPSLGFGHYLLGLQRLSQGAYVLAAESLDRGLALGVPGIAFEKNGARRLAVAAYRTGDRRRVELAITMLTRSGMSAADRLLAQDWFERLAFDDAR